MALGCYIASQLKGKIRAENRKLFNVDDWIDYLWTESSQPKCISLSMLWIKQQCTILRSFLTYQGDLSRVGMKARLGNFIFLFFPHYQFEEVAKAQRWEYAGVEEKGFWLLRAPVGPQKFPGVGEDREGISCIQWFTECCSGFAVIFVWKRKSIKSHLGTAGEMGSSETRQPNFGETSEEWECKMGTQTRLLVQHPESGAWARSWPPPISNSSKLT